MTLNYIGRKDTKIKKSFELISKKKRTNLALPIGLFFLIILFEPISCLAEENLSISGIVFLDFNSNGKKDISEPGLEGYLIYIDDNDNSQWEQNEPSVRTGPQGIYNNLTINVSRKPRVIRALMTNEQLHPSYPDSGFHLIDQSSPNALTYNFGYYIKKPEKSSLPPWSYSALIGLIFFVAASTIIFGLFILYKGLSKLWENKADNNTLVLVGSGLALLFIGLYLLTNTFQQAIALINTSSIDYYSGSSITIPVLLGLLIFGAAMLMCQFNANQHEQGSMRRMISGVLVIGLIGVIFYSLNNELKNNKDIITQYVQLVGMIIAFYFGSRVGSELPQTLQDKIKNKEKINIKCAEYNTNAKVFRLRLANDSGIDSKVQEIIINEGDSIVGISKSEDLKQKSGIGFVEIIATLKDQTGKINPIEFNPNTDYEIILSFTGKETISIFSKIKIRD
jgi:hypothetical protein